jgi:SAM-dependent methyltransferase
MRANNPQEGAMNCAPTFISHPLFLDAPTFRTLLELQGPSLALWRAAEIAVLREQFFEPPVLDLGCGDGIVMSMVLSQVEIGLDPDQNAIKQAARQCIYKRFEIARAESSTLPDACIGTVLSNSVLEHIPQVDAVLASVSRLLRPGGRLIFTTPTDTFSAWLALPLPAYARWRNRQLRHLNLWSVEQWDSHLSKAGLQLELVSSYLRHSLVAAWDMLELLQHVWLCQTRLFSLFWRSLPSAALDHLALRASQIDLSSSTLAGGGRLMITRKP